MLYPEQHVFDELSQLLVNHNDDLAEAIQRALQRIQLILVEQKIE